MPHFSDKLRDPYKVAYLPLLAVVRYVYNPQVLVLKVRVETGVRGETNPLLRQASKRVSVPLPNSQIFRLKNSILSEWLQFRMDMEKDSITTKQ